MANTGHTDCPLNQMLSPLSIPCLVISWTSTYVYSMAHGGSRYLDLIDAGLLSHTDTVYALVIVHT